MIVLMCALMLGTGCKQGQTSEQDGKAGAEETGESITVEHAQGSTEVPENVERVAVYSIAVLDILDALEVDVAGVAGEIFPPHIEQYADRDRYEGVGTLFEPDYEALNALDPDLILVGARSSAKYDRLAEMAPTLDLTVDPTAYLESVITNTKTLGELFGEEEKAESLVQTLRDEAAALREQAAEAGTALVVLTTGGKMSAFAPSSRFGFIHNDLGFQPAVEGLETGRHGEAISAEFILERQPDWLFVVDRDAAIGREGAAEQVLDNELMAQTKVSETDQIVYLDPRDVYLAGGGVQATRQIIDQISKALEGSE